LTLYRCAFHRVRANLITGYIAWLLLTPIVLAVHFATVHVYYTVNGTAPADHPLVKAIHEDPSLLHWALVFLSAAVLAPVLEEILFRGLLQAWMTRGGRAVDVVPGMALVIALLDFQRQGMGPVVFMLTLLPVYILADLWARRWPRRADAARAILGSSMLFAAFHSSVWPSPIPLFVLGLGLGFLAYRTQSLVGPIFLHATFNSVACVLLVLNQAFAPPSAMGSIPTVPERRPVAVSISSVVPESWLPRRNQASATTHPAPGE
jgi:membrane protease YdiL (CAAX protease family)